MNSRLNALSAALAVAGMAASADAATLDMPLKLRGEMRCVLNAGTEREHDTGWFNNLITNNGLDLLAFNSPATFAAFCSIGTGTTAPANTQTALTAFTASTSCGVSSLVLTNLGSPTYAYQITFPNTFAQGAVVGNMAEIGVGRANNGTNLFARALILDGGGSPTTLTVTSIDQLTVYYRLTVYPPLTDLTGTLTLSGTDYAYTGRLSLADSFSPGFVTNGSQVWWAATSASSVFYQATSTLGAITAPPSGSTAAGGSFAVAAYTNGNKYLDYALTVGTTQGNATGGIGAMQINNGGMQFQYKFTTPIPKDNTKVLTINYRLSWDRV